MRGAVIVHGRGTGILELEEKDMAVIRSEDDLGSGEAGNDGRWWRGHRICAGRHHLSRRAVAGWMGSVLGVGYLMLELGMEVARWTGRVYELAIGRGDWRVYTGRWGVREETGYCGGWDDLDEVARLNVVNFNKCWLERNNVGILQSYDDQRKQVA